MATQSNPIEGRLMVVTGAAGGIGLATAQSLLDAGARVHCIDVRPLMEERLGAARLSSGRAGIHVLDVRDADAVDHVMSEIGAESPIDALICCAGTNVPERRFDQLTWDAWNEIVDTNMTGVYSCVRAAMPQLYETRGHVVVVVSVSAQWPDVSGPAYQASKAGALAFVRAAALEQQDYGVRFTVVHPGWTDTELLEKRPVPPPEEMRVLALQPEDVAATIVFALSLPPRACVAELSVLPTTIQVIGRDATAPRARRAELWA